VWHNAGPCAYAYSRVFAVKQSDQQRVEILLLYAGWRAGADKNGNCLVLILIHQQLKIDKG
jgi:hypothetical protein